jgi:hypothetical protein
MNLAPLDSSRQAASFERKIFENKKIIFLRISQKFLFEKKLFDERNPTVQNSLP